MLSELRRKVFSGKAVRSKNSHFYFIEKKKKEKKKIKKTNKGKDANRSKGPCPSFVKRPTLS